ncbi:MAG: hypothetical protein K0B52_03545 [FCB group bacterium]|nr:hypothetical protein [FCB group bacterium]
MRADFEQAFHLFYNYRFKETESYLQEKISTLENPFPYYAFLSYARIRSQLANAEYDLLLDSADNVIKKYRPLYEARLRNSPNDVDALFYYTVLISGKMRIYLNKMDYFAIIKEAPRILSNKLTIDQQKSGFAADMAFGTGSFDYYLSVVGRNLGLGNLMTLQQSDGLRDLWYAYEHAELTRWEAAIVLMYIYLYDKMEYTQCRDLYVDFLDMYPDNLEVRAIAAECSYYLNDFKEGDKHARHIVRMLDNGILHNDIGWRSRVLYIKGIRAMLKDQHAEALEQFNRVYETNQIEYSWYQTIVLKYTADIYLKMGLVRTAKLYYEETAKNFEFIPHVREAKDILKTLK